MKKTKVSPISKNNTETTAKPRVECRDEYYSYKTKGMTFITNNQMAELAEKLEDWAKNDPNAYKVKQFVGMEGIPEATWIRWVAKWPELHAANEQAKMHIGARREIGALKRELDVGMVSKMMIFYDKDHRDTMEIMEKMKNKDGEGSGETKVVVVAAPAFPDCKEVKPLREKHGKKSIEEQK